MLLLAKWRNLAILVFGTLLFGFGCSDDPSEPAHPIDEAMGQIDQMIADADVDTTQAGWKTRVPIPRVATFHPDLDYYVRIVTSHGTMLIRFLPETAPFHVTNFIYLTRLGYYDDVSFHRVIPGFMAQGGDPTGTGSGGPGYRYPGEFDANVRHDRKGRVSMANAGPGTDGSQFFITFVQTPWLDGRHSIFGDVIEGFETVDAIENVGTQGGEPLEDVIMVSVVSEVRSRNRAG